MILLGCNRLQIAPARLQYVDSMPASGIMSYFAFVDEFAALGGAASAHATSMRPADWKDAVMVWGGFGDCGSGLRTTTSQRNARLTCAIMWTTVSQMLGPAHVDRRGRLAGLLHATFLCRCLTKPTRRHRDLRKRSGKFPSVNTNTAMPETWMRNGRFVRPTHDVSSTLSVSINTQGCSLLFHARGHTSVSTCMSRL